MSKPKTKKPFSPPDIPLESKLAPVTPAKDGKVSSVELFSPPKDRLSAQTRRPTTEETAKKLIQGRRRAKSYTRIYSYIEPSHKEKLKQVTHAFTKRYPRAPKLLESEVIRMLIEKMPEGEAFEKEVTSYRS